MMEHFTLEDILQMQNALQEKYKNIWEPIGPETGKSKLLWLVAELGEVIDIVKKQGTDRIMHDPATRRDFVEEMADVLMYYGDIMNCYGISEAELKKAYEEKFKRNMERW